MTYTRLVLANLGRNKLRTAFTGGAITLAVMLVCLLLTMPATLDLVLEEAASDVRISVHHKAGLVYPMPYSFTRKVRNIDGVAAAMGVVWFGGAYEESGTVTFPNFAVESEHFGGVYPDYEIPPEQISAFERYRDGALVGGQTAEKYGWKIGDRITLQSTAWPVSLDMRIVGIVPNSRLPSLWFNRKYLDEAMKAAAGYGVGFVGTIWVRAGDPNRVGAIMQQIEEMSRNSDAEATAETEKSFFQGFFGSLQGFIRIIMVVTALVTLCIIFIAANTASMTVRERSGEIAVLKAIGFARRTIFGQLFSEVVLLASVAGLIGVGAALGLGQVLSGLAAGDDSLGPLASFIITAPVLVQGVFLSLFIGMLAGIVPSYGAARKPVVETLHEIF